MDSVLFLEDCDILLTVFLEKLAREIWGQWDRVRSEQRGMGEIPCIDVSSENNFQKGLQL